MVLFSTMKCTTCKTCTTFKAHKQLLSRGQMISVKTDKLNTTQSCTQLRKSVTTRGKFPHTQSKDKQHIKSMLLIMF